METPPLKWTCDWCGCEFDPDPDSMVESGISAIHPEPDPSEEWKDTKAPTCDTPDLATASPETLEEIRQELGLTPEQLQELIATGHTNTGYSCLCPTCLEDEGEPPAPTTP